MFQKYPENFTFQLFIIYNLPTKFAIFLKSTLLLTVPIVFSFYKQNFTAQ